MGNEQKKRERKNTRNANGEGYVQKIGDNKYKAYIQSRWPDIDSKNGNPKRFSATRSTKEEALKAVKQKKDAFETQIKNRMNYLNKRTAPFADYVDDYIEKVIGNVDNRTRQEYYDTNKRYIRKYQIGRLQLGQLSELQVRFYYQQLAEKYANKTINGAVALCKRVADFLVNHSMLDKNYFNLVPSPVHKYTEEERLAEYHRKKRFTIDDIKKFYEYYQSVQSDISCVTIFLLETAMRPSEFRMLKNSDFDYESKIITIARSEGIDYDENNRPVRVPNEGKTHTIRSQKMSNLCCEVAQNMAARTSHQCKHNPDDWFFPSFRTGQPRSLSSLEVCFRDLCNFLEIDRGVVVVDGGARKRGLNIYALRHTNITVSASIGLDSQITASQHGHSERTANENYVHIDKEILANYYQPSIVNIAMNNENIENSMTEEQQLALYERLKKKFGDSKDEK